MMGSARAQSMKRKALALALTLLLGATCPALAGAFDCSTDQGMAAASAGQYRNAFAIWQEDSGSSSSRAAVKLMGQWGALVYPKATGPVEASTSDSELSAFVSSLKHCPASRQGAAGMLRATAYTSGSGVERDTKKAQKEFDKAVRHGDALSRLALAAIASVNNRPQDAYALATRALSSSVDIDPYLVGRLLYDGCIFERNRPEAVRWFEIGAQKEDWRSQRALAYMLIVGKDTPRDRARGEALIRAAAENPDAVNYDRNASQKEIIQGIESYKKGESQK